MIVHLSFFSTTSWSQGFGGWRPRIEPTTFLLLGNSANNCATLLQCSWWKVLPKLCPGFVTYEWPTRKKKQVLKINSDWENLINSINSNVSVLVLTLAILALFVFDVRLIPNSPPPNCVTIPAKQSSEQNSDFWVCLRKDAGQCFWKNTARSLNSLIRVKTESCHCVWAPAASSSFLPPNFLTLPVPSFLSWFYITTTMWMREVGKTQVARKVMMVPVVTAFPHSAAPQPIKPEDQKTDWTSVRTLRHFCHLDDPTVSLLLQERGGRKKKNVYVVRFSKCVKPPPED